MFAAVFIRDNKFTVVREDLSSLPGEVRVRSTTTFASETSSVKVLSHGTDLALTYKYVEEDVVPTDHSHVRLRRAA